jgi:cell wall-associated NlpC family hydrolase
VRYRNGGLSKAGIDCSGLVYLTYRDRFGIQLPRSTNEQVGIGSEVGARQWRAGDLLFFRINRWTNHVGIYLEEGRFLHASTSSGVMISHVDDPYWKSRYWTATRPAGDRLVRRD